MGFSGCAKLCFANIFCGIQQCPSWGSSLLQNPLNFRYKKLSLRPLLVVNNVMEVEKVEINKGEEEKERFLWVEIGSNINEEQKEAISQLPKKMMNRCKSLMKQIICYSDEKGSVEALLSLWVKSMKPTRAHWLAILKELNRLDHPLYLKVAEFALLEESFEANVRDYTKIIHGYANQNRLQEAEKALIIMKERGFMCDQVTLTALIHMYSKAGLLKVAENTFEEMKLLDVQLDKRSYGSMIMAYIRADMCYKAESLLKEMEAKEIYAGREVYKALLRAYSMNGNSKGAQRVFDSIQLAGILPDPKVCGLLINAYVLAGENEKACIAFENIKRGGIEPNDKCVALILSVYEKENKMNKALEFLIGLERDGIMLKKESSEILVGWFKRIGVVEEVEIVLRGVYSTGSLLDFFGILESIDFANSTDCFNST